MKFQTIALAIALHYTLADDKFRPGAAGQGERRVLKKKFKAAKKGKVAKKDTKQETVYEILHGSKEHQAQYHPETKTIEELLHIYEEDPLLFKLGVNQVYSQKESFPYARFHPDTRSPGFVASIAPIPEDEQQDFVKTYISRESFCPLPQGYSQSRDVQYPHWEWANENIDIFVNQLRLSNFTDDKITDMFNGTPMWVKDKAIFEDFRQDLSRAALGLEEDAGWRNVGVVFTGSSVIGFSQNPCKGNVTVPTAITSVDKSDVDVAFHADGAIPWALANNVPRFYPTTIDEYTTSVRVPISRTLYPVLGARFEAFVEKWEGLLEGGLQFTVYEDENRLPPWESRAVYGRRLA